MLLLLAIFFICCAEDTADPGSAGCKFAMEVCWSEHAFLGSSDEACEPEARVQRGASRG